MFSRYQCRLGLTSKYHYKYLYNDLLRWHAQKSPIKPPKYKQHHNFSIIQYNKQAILYNLTSTADLLIHNLTHLRTKPLYGDIESHRGLFYSIRTGDMIELCEEIKNIDILSGFYKYMRRKFLRVYFDSKHPLISICMLWKIMGVIGDHLDCNDFDNLIESSLCLRHMYA